VNFPVSTLGVGVGVDTGLRVGVDVGVDTGLRVGVAVALGLEVAEGKGVNEGVAGIGVSAAVICVGVGSPFGKTLGSAAEFAPVSPAHPDNASAAVSAKVNNKPSFLIIYPPS
jgi:hypothetical protein